MRTACVDANLLNESHADLDALPRAGNGQRSVPLACVGSLGNVDLALCSGLEILYHAALLADQEANVVVLNADDYGLLALFGGFGFEFWQFLWHSLWQSLWRSLWVCVGGGVIVNSSDRGWSWGWGWGWGWGWSWGWGWGWGWAPVGWGVGLCLCLGVGIERICGCI